MFTKLIYLSEEINLSLQEIPLPVEYRSVVVQRTLDLIGQTYIVVELQHNPLTLINQSERTREETIHQDIVLIEKILTHVHTVMQELTSLTQRTVFGSGTNKLLDQLITELAILEHIPIINATEESVAILEAAISTLIKKRGRYKNVFEIRETQATLERLNIKNYTTLTPAAKTLILLRSFAIGVLFQTFNGFEMVQHETCVELGGCNEEKFYTELLPSLVACSMLFHHSLERSLRILMTWVEQDYLHTN